MEEVSMRVAVRIRPLCRGEILEDEEVCVQIVDGQHQVKVNTPEEVINFDHAFGPNLTQKDVFDTCVHPLVPRFIEGCNTTVFTYGQTGSGKTYTMGTLGIIPRAIDDIFNLLNEKKGIKYSLATYYIEIYNEELRDLLEKKNDMNIILRDDKWGNTECAVNTKKDLLHFLEEGSTRRRVGNTLLRKRSSRSHTIFTIFLRQQRGHSQKTKDGIVKGEEIISKFTFIDLAGHERMGRSENKMRFNESININKSLSTLAQVISSLAIPNTDKAHIPFRNSKLTRILKDSLEGNAKTVMIVCINPASTLDTLTSLKYANQARDIKPKTMVNHVNEQYKQELRDRKKAVKQHLQERKHVSTSLQRSLPDKLQTIFFKLF
uniref:Kinesin motor domain-containing protein n=1 Tax=Eptatretus burgeri TaxID=7764 RepID=A0A8C4QGG4_EPTBU